MSLSFRDLVAGQKAQRLAVQVYERTEGFPKSETYGLTSQTRRAAVSIVSNIAEGQGRLTPGEFQQFLGNSRGSLLELETQLEIAFDLKLLDSSDESLMQGCYQVLGLVNRLIESLGKKRRPMQPNPSKRETLKL